MPLVCLLRHTHPMSLCSLEKLRITPLRPSLGGSAGYDGIFTFGDRAPARVLNLP